MRPNGQAGGHSVEDVDRGGGDRFGDSGLPGEGRYAAAVEPAEDHALGGVAVFLSGVRSEDLSGDAPVQVVPFIRVAFDDDPVEILVPGQRRSHAQFHAGKVGADEQVAGVGGDTGTKAALPGYLLEVWPD